MIETPDGAIVMLHDVDMEDFDVVSTWNCDGFYPGMVGTAR